MIVIDASALLEVLLRTPAAGEVEKWLFDPGQTLHAPHLLDVEVVQVIRRYAANGEIDSVQIPTKSPILTTSNAVPMSVASK